MRRLAIPFALVLAVGVLAASCARPERTASHAEWMREATRVWPGETRARVIAAAEAVLRQSDPRDIRFEYSRQGFVARRRFFIFAILATVEGEDRWTFHATENAEGASASVRIIQRGVAQAGRVSERIRDNQTTIGGFRLFYARIDYLLGKRPDWVTCADAPAKLGLPREAPGLQGLCGLTHQSTDAPPAPLPRAASAKVQPKAPPEPPQIAAGEDED